MNTEKSIEKLESILRVYKNMGDTRDEILSSINLLIFFIRKYEKKINVGYLDELNSTNPYDILANDIIYSLNSRLSNYDIIKDENGKDNDAITYSGNQIILNKGRSKWLFFTELNNDFKRLDLLKITRDNDKNVVLLGANGSGKSSLANFLKNSEQGKLVVIPAQKYLYLDSRYVYDADRLDYDSIRNEQRDKDFKYLPDSSNYIDNFKKVIISLVNEFIEEASNAYRGKEGIPWDDSIIGNLFRIFNELLPRIQLNVNAKTRSLVAVSAEDGKEYDFNLLSDGERAVVFYLVNILIAEKNSIVVIDEPETYINPSVYKKLWDRLLVERCDCQFIFITHSVDFIASRDPESTSFYWLKKFNPPENWEIEPLPNIGILPKTLVAELAGSQKPILFCEGEYESWDYQIYSILFGKIFTVQPVGGHISVINYTKAFNESSHLHHNKAIGIIDGDLTNEEREINYRKDQVFVLPFNEIEMLLLWEPIIRFVLSPYLDDSEIDKKIAQFKKAFFNEIQEYKDKIITASIKKEIDNNLEHYRIQSFESVIAIKSELEGIKSNLANVEELEKNIDTSINDLLESSDYLGLLKLCNLKGQVLNGLGNKELDSKYAERAKAVISKNEKLQKDIWATFFSEILFENY